MPPEDWYVNLPAEMDRGTAKNHGPTIPITVSRSGRTATSRKVRKARWSLTWEPRGHDHHFNKVPKFRSGDKAGDFAVDLNEVNKAFVNFLEVPVTGGITYTVNVRKAPNQGADNVALTREYLAKRVLYYQIEYMDEDCKALFESILEHWKAAFAPASIALVPRGEPMKLDVDEIFTNRSGDPGLEKRKKLTIDRRPCHIRIVVVNEVGDIVPKAFSFSMKRTTLSPDVRYEHSTIKILTGQVSSGSVKNFAVKSLVLRPSADPVEVPAEFITTSISDGTQYVDISFENPTFEPLWKALEQKNPVIAAGRLRGRVSEFRPVEAEISVENGRDSALTVGDFRIWVEVDALIVQLTAEGRDFCHTATIVGNNTAAVGGKIIRGGGFSVREVADKQVSLEVTGKILLSLQARETIKVNLTFRLLSGLETNYPFQGSVSQAGGPKIKMTAGGEIQAINRKVKICPASFWLTSVHDVTVAGSSTLDVTPHATALTSWSDNHSELRIHVDRPNLETALAAFGADREVQIEVNYKWHECVAGYYKDKSDTVILSRYKSGPDEGAAITRKRLLCTAVHEVGHALSVARKAQEMPGWLAGDENSNFYDNHGGSPASGGLGGHCKAHAHSVESPRTSSSPNGRKMVPDADATTICVMFHTMAFLDRMEAKFCETCLNHLIRNDVRLKFT